jgi:cytochrome bd-I ubiquinol oxidase subunit X
MWYFSWILGIGVALAFGIINVMWFEARRNPVTVKVRQDLAARESTQPATQRGKR